MAKAGGPYRPLNDFERAVIARMLEADDHWRDRLRGDLETALVRPWPECTDHCGSVEFRKDESSSARSAPLPVEGRFTDADGLPIEILLFERDGELADLEFVVYSDRMKRAPDVAEIEVRSVSRHPGNTAEASHRRT